MTTNTDDEFVDLHISAVIRMRRSYLDALPGMVKEVNDHVRVALHQEGARIADVIEANQQLLGLTTRWSRGSGRAFNITRCDVTELPSKEVVATVEQELHEIAGELDA